MVNIPRFVDEIQNNFILHAFAEFVGVDVAAEDFEAGLPVLLQKRSAREADENGIGHHGFHDAMQFAALRAVTFIHENKDFADRLAGLLFQFLDVSFEVIHALTPELVDQRTQEPRRCQAKLLHQVATAAGAVDALAGFGEDTFDLFIQFIAVGDDGDAGVGIVLQDPFGEQDHDNAFATALRVPDDAALPLTDMFLRGFDAEVLMGARKFLDAIEQNEVVHQFDEAIFLAELEQVFIQFEAGVILFVFLPVEEVFFRCGNCPIFQAFAIIARKYELDRGKEPLIEILALDWTGFGGCRRQC